MTKIFYLFLCCFLVSACSYISPFDPQPEPATLEEGGYTRESMQAISFDRVIPDLPLNAEIGRFKSFWLSFDGIHYECEEPYGSLYWSDIRSYFDDRVIGQAIGESLKINGIAVYTVKDQPNKEGFEIGLNEESAIIRSKEQDSQNLVLFNSPLRDQAPFRLGGKVQALDLSLCTFDTGTSKKFKSMRIGGTARALVEWQVYDTRSNTVVYRYSTDGDILRRLPVIDGMARLIEGAVIESALKLAKEEEFRQLLYAPHKNALTQDSTPSVTKTIPMEPSSVFSIPLYTKQPVIIKSGTESVPAFIAVLENNKREAFLQAPSGHRFQEGSLVFTESGELIGSVSATSAVPLTSSKNGLVRIIPEHTRPVLDKRM